MTEEEKEEAFEKALCEAISARLDKEHKEFMSDVYDQPCTFSRRFKRRINRLFKKNFGVKSMPYPEEATIFDWLF